MCRMFAITTLGNVAIQLDSQGVTGLRTRKVEGLLIYSIDLAQTRVTRALTDAECQTYLHVEVCPS